MALQYMPRVELCVANEGHAFAKMMIPIHLLSNLLAQERLGAELENIEKSCEVAPLRNDIVVWLDGDTGALMMTIKVNPFAEQDTVHRMLLLQHLGKRAVQHSFPIDLSNLAEIQHRVLQ